MDPVIDVAADSSPASIEVPRAPEAYAEWRRSGKVEAPAVERTPKADPAPAKKDTPAAAEAGSEPASEAANQDKQERKRSNAETRLNEILADLKTAGLSPSELKTYKREAQKSIEEGKAAPPPPEQTAKPAQQADPSAPKAPVKPKVEDFETYEKFEEAKDKYYEELADHRAELKFHQREQAAQQAAQQAEVKQMLAGAKERYGAEAEATISETAKTVFNDAQIPSAIKAIINDSPVMVDLLYTLGSKELSEFVALAKAKPGEAIRKAVLLESLVQQELAGKGSAAKADSEAPGRDESGKFVSAAKTEPPAKKITQAPPPPREASGRSAAPPDELESAAKSNDFDAYRSAANRRDLARLNGRAA